MILEPYRPLPHLLEAMVAEAAWRWLLWWDSVEHGPEGLRHLLAQYAAYGTALLAVEAGGDRMGVILADEGIVGLRTRILVWYPQSLWGAPAQDATNQGTAHLHTLGYGQVWGITPWRRARAHAQRCGYRDMATFPRYVVIGGRPASLYFLVHEVEYGS